MKRIVKNIFQSLLFVPFALILFSSNIKGLNDKSNVYRVLPGLDGVKDTIVGDTTKLQFPFKDNSVDTIITRYALHHFPDLKSRIKEMYRILRPDGKVIISDPTPNENDTSGFVDKFMQMKPDGHIKFYHLNEYLEMFDSVGFHILSSNR